MDDVTRNAWMKIGQVGELRPYVCYGATKHVLLGLPNGDDPGPCFCGAALRPLDAAEEAAWRLGGEDVLRHMALQRLLEVDQLRSDAEEGDE